ncbi:MAG: AMIN domain-containing protein [Synergistetes bacterium]|nr:AMIN domain-containing protein [Synergistota bacterium]
MRKKGLFVLAFLLLVCLSVRGYALERRIMSVRVFPTKTWVKLVIRLTSPAVPVIDWLPGDRERMVLTFKGFYYSATLRRLPLHRSDIWEVRGGQFKPGEARVVVEFFSSRLYYRFASKDKGKTLVYFFYPVKPRKRAPIPLEKRLFYIRRIDVVPMGESLKVAIRGDAPLDPKVSWIKGKIDRMVLDFYGFVLKTSRRIYRINRFGVVEVRAGQFTPEIVRVVIELKLDEVNYKLQSVPAARKVLIYFYPRVLERSLVKKPVSSPTTKTSWASKEINLDFRDVDVRDIFRALAKVTGVNLILDSSVSGKLTVSFKNVPFAQAFDWLLRMTGLSYRNLGNTLVIGSEDRLKEMFDKKITRVFVLSNASVESVVGTVSSITGVKDIIVDQRMNALIVKASPLEMKRVEKVIQLIDQEVPQVMVEAKLVGISLEKEKNLGFFFSNVSKGKFYNINIAPGSPITISYSSDESAAAMLDATINAWISSGKAKVLASPSVATLSGLKAVINLTRDYKYFNRVEEIKDSERTIKQEWKTITYGPKLVITPYVGRDSKITLAIDIDVSIVTRWIEYEGQRIPEIGHRKVTTKLRVRDGQPIVIGGLITEEDIKNLFKVPLLGDLPIIGQLFRSQTSSRKREEVVLIVTPRILKE